MEVPEFVVIHQCRNANLGVDQRCHSAELGTPPGMTLIGGALQLTTLYTTATTLVKKQVKRRRLRPKPGPGGCLNPTPENEMSGSSRSDSWSIASVEVVGAVHTSFTFNSLADAQARNRGDPYSCSIRPPPQRHCSRPVFFFFGHDQ